MKQKIFGLILGFCCLFLLGAIGGWDTNLWSLSSSGALLTNGRNIALNGAYVSGDGDSEGITVASNGNVTVAGASFTASSDYLTIAAGTNKAINYFNFKDFGDGEVVYNAAGAWPLLGANSPSFSDLYWGGFRPAQWQNMSFFTNDALRMRMTNGGIGVFTPAPAGVFHIDALGGSDSTGFWITNASVSTSNNSPTTIYTLATQTDRNYRIVADVSGAQDDGSNSMATSWSFVLKNVAGTVTELQDAAIGTEFDDSAGVSISGAVSGTDYLIQVTGITSENWNWEVSIKVTTVEH